MQYFRNQQVLWSIGGADWGNNWGWVDNYDQAVAMGRRAASWKNLYGIAGIDIDAEEGNVEQKNPENMAAFIATIKQIEPSMLIS